MLDDTVVCFMDIENLKRNKQAAGRLQDLADVEQLSHPGAPRPKRHRAPRRP